MLEVEHITNPEFQFHGRIVGIAGNIQAMEQGGTLTVRLENEQRDTVVIVRDTGIGIEQENLARLFDPYFTTKSDGTGLGLAMSAKIVEEHGGKIEIRSVAREYTEVRVVLPS